MECVDVGWWGIPDVGVGTGVEGQGAGSLRHGVVGYHHRWGLKLCGWPEGNRCEVQEAEGVERGAPRGGPWGVRGTKWGGRWGGHGV